MIRLVYISLIGIGAFTSCSNDAQSINSEPSNDEIVDESNGLINPEENSIYFENNLIRFQEEKIENEIYRIPEITHQRSDILFTAKRIPTDLYLKNKGLKGEELQLALKETEGEQLFYFEFEENQKQDLIKKYLEKNIDENISYLSFSIFKDFSIINSTSDTIVASYSVYERNFHVAPYERVIVGFNGISQDEEIKLLYNDILFGKGKLEFAFASTSYLENNIKNPS